MREKFILLSDKSKYSILTENITIIRLIRMNNTSNKKRIVSIVAVVIAVLLMIAGYNRNEFQTYFAKAVQICTQCIGIG